MQFSIAKLILAVSAAAVLFAAFRSYHIAGPMCLPLGVLLLLSAGISYPIAILSSPQEGWHLDPSANPVLPYSHKFAATGFLLLVLFCFYLASNIVKYI